MHMMPAPVVHRDVKSMNIMVMEDGTTGKIGDCGESRRVDLNSTMTRTGSPLWAAPELIAGKRYSEDVDTFSIGVVMYEIAMRALPYPREREQFKKSRGKGLDRQMMRKIGAGEIRPELVGSDVVKCKRYGIGRSFRRRRLSSRAGRAKRQSVHSTPRGIETNTIVLTQVMRRCVAFDPKKRPTMADVARLLTKVYEDSMKRKSKLAQSRSKAEPEVAKEALERSRTKEMAGVVPWPPKSPVAASFGNLISRIADPIKRANLTELTARVQETLGAECVDPLTGAFNPSTLLRILNVHDGDVEDATSNVVVCFNARYKRKMEEKRKHIIDADLSFQTLPRFSEWKRYQPCNPFMGTRTTQGHVMRYFNFGGACDFDAAKRVGLGQGGVRAKPYCNHVQHTEQNPIATTGRTLACVCDSPPPPPPPPRPSPPPRPPPPPPPPRPPRLRPPSCPPPSPPPHAHRHFRSKNS